MILTQAAVRPCPQCLHKGPHPKLLFSPILVAVLAVVADLFCCVLEVGPPQGVCGTHGHTDPSRCDPDANQQRCELSDNTWAASPTVRRCPTPLFPVFLLFLTALDCPTCFLGLPAARVGFAFKMTRQMCLSNYLQFV